MSANCIIIYLCVFFHNRLYYATNMGIQKKSLSLSLSTSFSLSVFLSVTHAFIPSFMRPIPYSQLHYVMSSFCGMLSFPRIRCHHTRLLQRTPSKNIPGLFKYIYIIYYIYINVQWLHQIKISYHKQIKYHMCIYKYVFVYNYIQNELYKYNNMYSIDIAPYKDYKMCVCIYIYYIYICI